VVLTSDLNILQLLKACTVSGNVSGEDLENWKVSMS